MELSKSEVDVDAVLSLRKYITIASHVRGRVRLKASMEILQNPLLQDLLKKKDADVNAAMKKLSGVVDVRLNAMARSIVIQYDPAKIALADINKFIETKDNNEAMEIAKKYFNELQCSA
jgi:copper chaperone CopZ